MGAEWQSSTLGEVATWYSGGTPSKDKSVYWNGEIPWISAKSMYSTWLEDAEDKITELGAANGTRLVDEGAILVLVRGSMLHQRVPIGMTLRRVAFNQDVKALVSKPGIEPKFLLYFLLAKEPELLSMVEFTGIGAGKLDTNRFQSMPIRIPPLETQRAIAHILGTLDDKIELNRRTNQTLEAIAKALFKSWFVDFEPVRARAEGRQPEGMDAQTAALFPDGLEDSELGEIPRGWTVSQIGREVDVVGGSTPSTKEPSFWDGGIHWVTPKDLSALSDPILLDTERKITELGLVEIGSGLLPKGTVLMSSRAPIGYLAVSQIPVATNQGFISMKCTKQLSSWYVLHWAEHNMEAIKGRANGTTFLEVSKANFRILPIVVPSTKTLEAFEVFAGSLFARVIANLEESRTLATLRDSLLPKLLSGELGVDGILGKTEMKYEQSSNNQPTAH